MSKFQTFWHWLTTSRYTREIERELAIKEAECAQLRKDVDALMCQIYPELKRARQAASPEGVKHPSSFNFPVR